MLLDTSTTRTAITTAPVPESLPTLVARAAETLANARTAAEVLEAGEMASFAYDVAKRQARLAKAKRAHDDLIAATHRAQADALEIEAQAKRRLADEYDAAQERGEVQKAGGNRGNEHTGGIIPDENNAKVSDIGLTSKEVHESRQIRDAEEVHPGIVRETLDAKLAVGEEPTRAAVKVAVARERRKPALDTPETAKTAPTVRSGLLKCLATTAAVLALRVGGGCRQPRRRHHGTRTNIQDGALVARSVAQSKSPAAISPASGVRGLASSR